METYTIRNSRKDDFDSIFAIWLENQAEAIGKNVSAASADPYRNELYQQFTDDQYAHFYVAENAVHEVVGWQALLPVIANPYLRKYAAQSNTYITPDHQYSDLGFSLVEYAVNDAKHHGIEQIYGWVKAGNTAINKIAEKFTNIKLSIPETTNLPDINLYVIQIK